MPNSDAPWTWGNSTIFAGITKLSQLGIDTSKDWRGEAIRNLHDPVLDQDAATRAWVLAQAAFSGLLSGLTIDTDKDWLAHLIKNLGDPVDAQDADTKAARTAALAAYLAKAGGTMAGAIAMGNNLITGLPTPVSDGDAARKKYVDDHSFSVSMATPDRDWDTVYHNLSGKPLMVVISVKHQAELGVDHPIYDVDVYGCCEDNDICGNVVSEASLYLDPDMVALASFDESTGMTLAFIVPVGYYYQLQKVVTTAVYQPEIDSWTEYTLG